MDEESQDEAESQPQTENFQAVVLLQLARIYDLHLALLTAASPNMAKMIGDLHASGEFFGPDPAIAVPLES